MAPPRVAGAESMLRSSPEPPLVSAPGSRSTRKEIGTHRVRSTREPNVSPRVAHREIDTPVPEPLLRLDYRRRFAGGGRACRGKEGSHWGRARRRRCDRRTEQDRRSCRAPSVQWSESREQPHSSTLARRNLGYSELTQPQLSRESIWQRLQRFRKSMPPAANAIGCHLDGTALRRGSGLHPGGGVRKVRTRCCDGSDRPAPQGGGSGNGL